MTPEIHDDRSCMLGEGPLWHAGWQALVWFDIVAGQLLSQHQGKPVAWELGEPASVAMETGGIGAAVVTASGLHALDPAQQSQTLLLPIEADREDTRSNDGRTDPWGGLWIGTMGRAAEPGAGAIYRVQGGKLHRLFPQVSVPNGICFAPDRSCAYLADSALGVIWRQPLDADGWPEGEREVLLDDGADGLPDGAVCDADGFIWSARWGGGCVMRIAPDGRIDHRIDLPTSHVTCPAFGGADHRQLYATTARQGLTEAQVDAEPEAGKTFLIADDVPGRPEPIFTGMA